MLPNDPKDPNKTSPPPPFGSSFDPHTNPQDPNNPYSSHYHQVQSELASHRLRDAHGRFIPEHPNQNPGLNLPPNPQIPPTTPNIPNPVLSGMGPNPSLPPNTPPIQVIRGGGGGNGNGEDDDNLAEFKLKNPFSKFFNWIKRLIKNEGIKITIKPLTAIAITVALTGGGGIIGGAIVYFFPHSSPILHRAVVYQGNLQKTDNGLFLTLPNSDLYTLRPKAKSSINFPSLTDGPVLVKGNLTVEKFVIDVEEIIPLNTPTPLTSPNIPNSPTSQTSQNLPDSQSTSDSPKLPELYSSITWETAQKKTLTFTSGKRRIEQEGVYLESSKINSYPYDFINYYISKLQDSGFKQTLNKIDPDGITTSFEKMGLYLTFGVKNVYSGSGDNKKIVGYRAYLEHN